MSLLEIIEKVPSMKGTIVAELLEVMQDGKFSLPDTPVAEGEKVIGEMNDYEKALYTLAEKYQNSVHDIAIRFRGQGRPVGREEEPKLVKQLECYKQRYDLISELMWDSIKIRLVSQADIIAPGCGIRSGCKVVLIFKADFDPVEDLIKSLIKKVAN